MPEYLKTIRLFVASPAEVNEERALLHFVVDELNEMFRRRLRIGFEILEWKQVTPGLGNPQQIIFESLPIEEWDVFIGILWLRFGAPSGNLNPHTGQPFASGTEEEFVSAVTMWREYRRPEVLFYRCDKPAPPTQIDASQLERVSKFFQSFEADGTHAGIYKAYSQAADFERQVRRHLTAVALKNTDVIGQRPEQAPNDAAPALVDDIPEEEPLFGRQQELATIVQALQPEFRGWGVVILGKRGIGKSALAIHAAHDRQIAGMFDRRVFVDVQRQPGVLTADTVLLEVARALGIVGIQNVPKRDRFKTIRSAIGEQRTTLLIFDHVEALPAEERSALDDFLQLLPSPCKAIVTTNIEEGTERKLRLEPLDWESSRRLIEHQIGLWGTDLATLAQAGETAWKQLYDRVGGLTIGILWVLDLIKQAAREPEGALSIIHSGPLEHEQLRRFLFDEVYYRMTPDEKTVMASLSLFRSHARADVLLRATGLSTTGFHDAVGALGTLSFVTERNEGGAEHPFELRSQKRFLLHPLARTLLLSSSKAEDVREASEVGFIRELAEYARKNGGFGKDAYLNYGSLEEEWPNLNAAAELMWSRSGVESGEITDVESARKLVQMANDIGQFLWFSGRRDERLEMHQRAYELSRRLGDWGEVAWHASVVAIEHLTINDLDPAAIWRSNGQVALEKEDYGPKWRYVRGALSRIAGLIASAKGDFAEAERLLMETLAIQEDRGEAEYIAQALSDLGDLAMRRGLWSDARSFYERNLAIARESGIGKTEAFALGNLGEVDLREKNWEAARAHIEGKLRLAKELDFRILVADAQARLAVVFDGLGRADVALRYAYLAHAAYQKLKPGDAPAVLGFIRELSTRIQE